MLLEHGSRLTGGGYSSFGLRQQLIGQKVCLDRTPVLIQPEGVRVHVVELLPHGSVAPLRIPVLPLGRGRVGLV